MFAMLAVTAAVGAYVAIVLYRWFLLPLGAPDWSTGQLFGLMFFLRATLMRTAEKKDDDLTPDQRFWKDFKRSLLTAGMSLFFGWLIHWLVY